MEKKNNVGHILKQYFEAQDIKQKEIAIKLGVSAQFINGVVNERNVVGKTLADKLQKYYGLSAAWLLTGKGDMLVENKQVKKSTKPQSRDEMELPLIPIDAMAGALSGIDESFMVYDCEKYIVPIFKGAEFLIRVQGDSMFPKYASGDIVACKRVELDRLWFQWGKTYVLDTRQGALVKRLEPSDKEGCIAIYSENPKYKPFDLEVEEIHAVALVVGTIRVE